MSANENNSSTLDFRLLFESAPGLHLVMDPSFTVVAVNDAHLRATLKTREDVIGRNVFDIFPDNPGDADATGSRDLRASLELVLATKQPDVMAMLKYDIRRPESQGGGFEERHWIPINAPALDANGEIVYIVQRVEDVTEFVRLKDSGQEKDLSAGDMRTQADQTDAQVFLRSQELGEANRQLVTANQELARLYEQISLLVTQVGNELTFPGEAPLTAELSHPMSSEEMLGRVGRLIIGHKRLEEELRQSQKMEAVGRLAGGIAHDFNNILTVINGYCSLLLNSLKPQDPVYRRLEEISKAGQRATDLTQQLLIFSRRQVLEPTVVNLASTLQDMDRMLRRLLGADIEIATSIDRQLAKVKVDPGQIQQVIMNLVVNARDAMPSGGKLTLQLTNVEVDPRQMPHYGVPHGNYVMLAVTDSGMGMTPEIQQQIFEPFFTTKESGKGTGLGLATVYGIVRQSGGHIWLYSEVGVGTTFKVFFPQVHDHAVPAPALAPISIARGDETLLVVEDDPKVRGLVREILQTAGYTVLVAGDATEAEQACKDHPGEIHLLLTDVVLPKTSGKEIANRLLARRPDLKVLFMSGYTGEAMAHHEILTEPSIEFLQKPFAPVALCSKIRAFLDTTVPKIRILIVDDEAAIRDLIETILENEGFRVATAGNGREAREKAKKQAFDLVLTDLSMPEEEGIEMIGRMRADHPELKIIAMSGAFGSDVMAAARMLGADATLMKPLNAVALVSCIHRLIDPASHSKAGAGS